MNLDARARCKSWLEGGTQRELLVVETVLDGRTASKDDFDDQEHGEKTSWCEKEKLKLDELK